MKMRNWPARIAEAQTVTEYAFYDGTLARIPCGSEGEGWGTPVEHCGDCGAEAGELHVPRCDLERCPRCGGQAISCGCRP